MKNRVAVLHGVNLGALDRRPAEIYGGLGFAAPERLGVSLGSAVGCTMGLEQNYVAVSGRGRHWLVDADAAVPELYHHLVPSSMAAEVAWEVGAEGPVKLVSTGCTSGLDAVGHGARLIADGQADVVLAGATDAPISPISPKKTTNASAVQTTASPATAPSAAAEGISCGRLNAAIGR